MNANRQHKPGPGRRYPPANHLVGRTDALRILGIGKRRFSSLSEQGVLSQAVVIDNGVKWYDRAWLEEFAPTIKKRRQNAPKVSLWPKGVPRVSADEERRITQLLLAGLTLGEIVLQTGKPSETIQHLKKVHRPDLARRELATALPTGEQVPDYYPELEPHGAPAKSRRGQAAAPKKEPPKEKKALGFTRSPRTLTTVPAHWSEGIDDDAPPPAAPSAQPPAPAADATAAAPRRTLTHVPDAWLGELPPLDEEDDDDD